MGVTGGHTGWKNYFQLFLLALFSVAMVGCGSSGDGPGINLAQTANDTLSGTIRIAAGATVDSDVNDPFPVYRPNDTFPTAQALINPVTLGGYLNVKSAGPQGVSQERGDLADFYRIHMEPGQTVTVTIADHSTGDLGLYLYEDDGSVNTTAPDYASDGSAAIETITLLGTATAGNYFIEVRVISGYSKYTLTVGQAIPTRVPGQLVSTDAFVAGDVIVKFRDDQVAPFSTISPAARAAAMGVQAKRGRSHHHTQLMALGDVSSRQATFKALGIENTNGAQSFRFDDAEKQLKFDTMQVIKALRKRPDVQYAEPNYIRQPSQVPTDPLYQSQWHYPLISLPAAWDVETGAPDVTVAVVDTGVLLNHPDLQGQFVSGVGYDFISIDAISGDGQPGIDANADDPGDSSGIGSSSFHGTHVAGTVAAATTFGADPNPKGVAGVAPGAKIMPVRVLGKGGGSVYDIMQGVRYAAGLSNDSGITLNTAQRADVINLSLGASGYSQIEQDLFTEVRNAGVIVVAAAGNENSSVPSYPAAYAGVISVSAVDISKQKAAYSNYGSTVDVTAPGGNSSTNINGDGFNDGVLSTLGDDSGATVIFSYDEYNGTSMAAPHVAGVLALMKSIYSALDPADVDTILQSGAVTEDLGESGRDDVFGHGLINAYSAVSVAQAYAGGSVTPAAPSLGVSPTALNLGAAETTALLSASNVGGGNLNVLSVTVTGVPAWLTVSEESVDATSKLGLYRITVDRNGLADGAYQADIIFTTDANSVTVPVLMQVVPQALNADAGYHYVLLVDAADFSVVGQWQGAAVSGQYQYQFEDVSFEDEREYYVIAGSDLDNDLFICDPGEACGAYFSLGQPRIINADSSRTGLDFITGFRTGIQASAIAATVKAAGGIKRPVPVTKKMQSDR